MKIGIVCLALAVVAAVAALATSSHIWKRDSGVTVTVSAQPTTNPQVFSSKDGMVLIDIGNNEEWYAYSRADNYLGYCQPPRKVRIFGYLYLWDETLPCVGYNEVKTADAHLIVDQDYVEFDARKGGRINVAWKRTP